MMSNTAKSFDNLAISIRAFYIIINIIIFESTFISKFLDISAKTFFLCSNICSN